MSKLWSVVRCRNSRN